MVEARPYQLEAIEAIEREFYRGVKDTLLVMATGTGKTYSFLTLLHKNLDGKRAIILAHRKELIDQPIERMLQYYPDWKGKIGIVMADQNEPDKQIVVATVQTLQNGNRLQEILTYGKVDYLVTDECHHSSAQSYLNIYEMLREHNPDLMHLGVTATPRRADGKGLIEVFKSVAFKYGILEAVNDRYLVPPRWLVIQTAISLKGIKTSAGDYMPGALAEIFETSNCFDLVVASWQKYGENRQTVAFTVSVKGAYDLAEKFNAAGISAAAADGTTDKKSRAKILSDFRHGKFKVLVNVGLYTEGLDIPELSCILQVRPTKSDSLYTQMIGRGLRIFPGKPDCLILDFAPKDARDIVMMGDILGVKQRKKETGEPGEIVGAGIFDGKKVKWGEGDPNNLFAKVVDYLNVSPWSWYKDDRGWMSLDLGRSGEFSRVLMISPLNDSDEFTLFGIAKKYEEVDDKERIVSEKVYRLDSGAWDAIEDKAGELIRKSGNPAMAKRNKEWRGKPPTTAQINFAQRLKVFILGDDRGTMSAKITAEVSYRALKKHGMI